MIRTRAVVVSLSILAVIGGAGCSSGIHKNGRLDQAPPGMGDYNNHCNPKSHNEVGRHLPRSQLCFEDPNGRPG